jgi:hypothetical protein
VREIVSQVWMLFMRAGLLSPVDIATHDPAFGQTNVTAV